MSVFHALYFVSYTATTIGFGEVPAPFSNAQRMWTVAVIHMTVIGWTYAVLTMIALFQEPAFQRAIGVVRFGRRVRRIGEPFYLILGCGDTGQRLIRILDRRDLRFVVVEIDDRRIAELELEDFRTDAPVIDADARSPQVLLHAGITHPACAAALALTNDDRANLAIAAAARLLNPGLPVLARVHTRKAAENLRSFGAEHIIDPFQTFAQHLLLAMRAPGAYRLLDWLTAAPGTQLAREHEPPRGAWVICGYGRFGRAIRDSLAAQGIPTRMVDPGSVTGTGAETTASEAAGASSMVDGIATELDVLQRAGIADAEGLVAGTDDDVANLAILALARQANPRLFTVARQNEAANQALFDRIRANLVMRPSEIVAEEAIARLTTPLLDRFLEEVRRQSDAWADEVIHQLRKRIGTRSPRTWSFRVDAAQAPALHAAIGAARRPVTLHDLLRHPQDREERIAARALLVLRSGRQFLLPTDDFELATGDRVLMAGRSRARRELESALGNVNVLEYLRTGRDLPGGWIWRRLTRGRRTGSSESPESP
jgi:Trk K+ transport system NAD-binding subunit